MSVRVKICGCASAVDVDVIMTLEPDAMGFIFHPGSPRAVSAEDVGAWTADLPPSILKVGVFVDAPLETIKSTVATARLDVVQLHGKEAPAFCATLGGRLWKAIPFNLEPEVPAMDYPVEALLLDYQRGEQHGGTGCTLDWAAAARFCRDIPRRVVLAGGLTPDNVQAAIRTVQPWGVDVSSGVEQAPGRKDRQRVKDFIAQCRANP